MKLRYVWKSQSSPNVAKSSPNVAKSSSNVAESSPNVAPSFIYLSRIYMSFFNKPFLDEYRNNDSIRKMLIGGELLTQSEFVSWYKPNESRTTRHRSEYKYDIESENFEIAMEFLDEIGDQVCRKIGTEYGQYALIKTANNLNTFSNTKNKFDILVAVSAGYDKQELKTTTTVQKNKNKSIVGFIVVERGECKLFRDQVCVNLICVKENTIKGSVLLGAYLYCIKSSFLPKNQRGLLELAGSYSNLAGFFSYTKLGFDKDESLFHKKCFHNPENLTMSVDLQKYEKKDIIDLVTGDKKRGDFSDQVIDDTGIFAYGALKEKKDQIIQEKIGKAYAIYHYLKMALKEPAGEDLLEEEMFLKLITDIEPRDTNDEKMKKIKEYITMQKNKLQREKSCTVSGGRTRKKISRRRKWILF